jgi:predicted transcriptional regulator of viral defense system
MRSTQLLERVNTPLFSDYQVARWFPDEPKQQINVQLARLARAGTLIRLKRGLYALAHAQPDELVMANLIYRPSYVSLESALNYYGMIPDVAGNVTSVSPVTSKIVRTSRGVFIYSKIARDLYFGYKTVKDAGSEFSYALAEAEKAVLDYVYIRKLRHLTDQRLDLEPVNRTKLGKYGRVFPAWVTEAINEQYQR